MGSAVFGTLAVLLHAGSIAALTYSSSSSSSLVSNELIESRAAPADSASSHWTPSRPDPYVCEYLGQNNCWRPETLETGPPYSHDGDWPTRNKTCTIAALDDPNGDDTPAILDAFRDCGENGHIVFDNTTYYIRTVMNTTGLKDVDVEIRGTLVWSKDIDYWLANSLPVGFQNQSTAWVFGGEGVHLYGHGYGTFFGNGQIWYDWNQGRSNSPGRPHAITISNTKNSVIEGLRFIQSQMWTMTVARSEKVLLQDIWVDNSCTQNNKFRCNVNTDGVDTVYANNITLLRWTVSNGDDSIALKQNSTNIYIANCTFHNGLGLAIGSIGQYPGQTEVIANVTAENIRFVDTPHAARIKTWTGLSKGFPPNGGGGGIGHARNFTFRGFELENVGQPWNIMQCTSYNGLEGGCDTSRFQIEDMSWGETRGTVRGDSIARLDCSAATPCRNIRLYDNNLTWPNGTAVSDYSCSNVQSPIGFQCTTLCADCRHRSTNGTASGVGVVNAVSSRRGLIALLTSYACLALL